MGWNGSGGSKANPVNVKETKARGVSFLTASGCALALLVAVTAAVFVSREGRVSPTAADGQGKDRKARLTRVDQRSRSRSPKDAVRHAMPKNLPNGKRRERPARPVELFEHLTGADRKMAEAVQAALDAEDFDKVVAAATESLASKNPEVRQNAVEALGWFGAQALPELTGAMADADEDVRQTAENHFELAVQELENSADQFNVAMAAFGTLSDADQLTSLGGLVSNAATEIIDGEDDPVKAAENRQAVLQALVDVIEGGSEQNAEAAKELYNDITGNEWHGIDEAQRYLDDPENYDPDDRPGAAEAAQWDDAAI